MNETEKAIKAERKRIATELRAGLKQIRIDKRRFTAHSISWEFLDGQAQAIEAALEIVGN